MSANLQHASNKDLETTNYYKEVMIGDTRLVIQVRAIGEEGWGWLYRDEDGNYSDLRGFDSALEAVAFAKGYLTAKAE